MEIIEKQVEKVKEVPADNYGYNYGRRDINGKANAGLTLGIIGTALGAWALFGGRRSASLLGGTGTGSGADANIAIATCGGSANGVNALHSKHGKKSVRIHLLCKQVSITWP